MLWRNVTEHLWLQNSLTTKTRTTRKSSCVNARGIPTAAYQVLHLLTEVGYPPRPPGLTWGVPEVGYPSLGYPLSGYPPSGYPLAGPGSGTPPRLDLARVPPPPPGVDRLKTLPSLILRMWSVINFATRERTSPLVHTPFNPGHLSVNRDFNVRVGARYFIHGRLGVHANRVCV